MAAVALGRLPDGRLLLASGSRDQTVSLVLASFIWCLHPSRISRLASWTLCSPPTRPTAQIVTNSG
ncbi:MAG TPA: hypothetical protein VGO86_19865 [Candidatus Dormibacteraeota bacterium]